MTHTFALEKSERYAAGARVSGRVFKGILCYMWEFSFIVLNKNQNNPPNVHFTGSVISITQEIVRISVS